MTKLQNYRQLSDELVKVMAELETGNLDIDEAVEAYARGLAIVKELEKHLKEAENKVIALKASAEDDEEEE